MWNTDSANVDVKEEDDDEIMPAKRKSIPKTVAQNDTAPPVQIEVKPCQVILQKVDEKRITRSSKRKAEMGASSECSESTEASSESSIVTPSEPKPPKAHTSTTRPPITSTPAAEANVLVKNTDKGHTIKSKKCMLCDKANVPWITSHYLNYHVGSEVYSARMSVTNSNQVRRNPPPPAERENGKIRARCHYCEKNILQERVRWVEHLCKHTGEYQRFCTKCNIYVTSTTEKTDKCSHTDPKCIPIVKFTDKLYVYMCKFCNWTQTQEENMKNHIRVMHEVNVNILNQYEKIILIPNFKHYRGSNATSTASDSETAASTAEDASNTDVFKPSDKLDDILSDKTLKLVRENSFNESNEPIRPTNAISIADRLSERFKKQKENATAIKEENDDTIVDDIVVRQPTETNESDGEDDQDWESCSNDSNDDADSPIKASKSLSRLIQSQGKLKPNKSRLFNKKRNSTGALPSIICKKEKLDETEINIEVKKDTSPEKSRRVDNITYSESLGMGKYRCNIGNCDFVSINNASSLSNHLRVKHNEAWMGYCHACDRQINNGKLNLMREYDHLLSFHVPKSTMAASNTTAPKSPEWIQQPQEDQEMPEPVEPEKPKFALRLRPLADLISIPGKTSNENNVNVSVPTQEAHVTKTILPSPVGQLPSATLASFMKPVDSENPLKPWTKCINTKSHLAEVKLKQECSLVALFKCMAIDCIFTTSDVDKMKEHLENHEESAADSFNAQIADDSSWLECCYCEEVAGSCSLLVKHINEVHKTSIFQCPHCFYRSADQQNVILHTKKYHSNTEETFVFVCDGPMKSLTDELKPIVQRQNEIKPLNCPGKGELEIPITVKYQYFKRVFCLICHFI